MLSQDRKKRKEKRREGGGGRGMERCKKGEERGKKVKVQKEGDGL